MLGKSLFATVALIAAVMLFIPRSDETSDKTGADPGAVGAESPWALNASQGNRSAAKSDGWGTALPRRNDGHFYAEVFVNDVPTHFMVDTGASTIALTGSDAEAIGLYWSEEDVVPVARGASGAVHGVRVTLDRVELGEFEASNLSAIIVPEGLDVSLLGQSFLSTIGNVQIRDNEMVLEE